MFYFRVIGAILLVAAIVFVVEPTVDALQSMGTAIVNGLRGQDVTR